MWAPQDKKAITQRQACRIRWDLLEAEAAQSKTQVSINASRNW